MAIIQSGASTDLLTIDPTFKTARVTIRPNELTGSYSAAAASGSIAAATAANSILYTFKYTGSGVCVIRRIAIGEQVTTAYTQGGIRFSTYFVRTTFTQGSTNATALTLTTNNAKKRTSHSTASVTAYICTTTGITGDTAAGEDSTPFATSGLEMAAAISARPVAGLVTMYDGFSTSVHPVVLAPNEGFRLKNDTAFAATGVGNLIVQVEWDEMTAY